MSRDDYRHLINRLIDEMSGEIALNGSHEHASIILERMFARAKHSVRIVSRSLDPRIYSVPLTMESCRRFVGDSKRQCRVLVEDIDNASAEKNEFFRMRGEFPNFEVRRVPRRLKKPVDITFALMDDSGFRFEKDATEATALTAFGEKRLTPVLSDVFEKIWTVSEEIPANLVAA